MVISRSDIKKRRKEDESLGEGMQGSPKRTKVHAQRKFAQGSSNLSSPALTPVKDKDKVKSNGTVVSPELIPSKRPKTEDFLTFLCFRGTSILPARLDFFNTAPVQENVDEDGSSVVGESSKPLPVASTSASRPSRMADQPQTQPAPRKNEKIEYITKRKPTTAVQALKKKYQEQRLARQRAGNLSKLVQKVKDKNMVRTRSAALMEESKPTKRIISSGKHIIKKSPVKIIHAVRKLKPVKRSPLRRVLLRRREMSRDILARRRGLRSGGQLPPGSEQGITNERTLKPAEPKVEKKVVEKSSSKSFASTLSDFSSDDDQPLVKKTKPVEQQKQLQKQQQNEKNHKQQFARKVIKRIVERSRRQKLQIVTRSRHQEAENKQETSTGVFGSSTGA